MGIVRSTLVYCVLCTYTDQCCGEQGGWEGIREHRLLQQPDLRVLQHSQHPHHERKPAEASGRYVHVHVCMYVTSSPKDHCQFVSVFCM